MHLVLATEPVQPAPAFERRHIQRLIQQLTQGAPVVRVHLSATVVTGPLRGVSPYVCAQAQLWLAPGLKLWLD
jgi:hypothetical protein